MPLFLTPPNQNLEYWDKPDSCWNVAAKSTRQADPFCCRTEWQLSYHETFAPDRNLYIRESANGLIALAQAPDKLRQNLFTPVEAHWLFGCPLLGLDAIDLFDQAITDIAEYITDDSLQPSYLISGLSPGSILNRQLLERFSNKFEFYKFSEDTLCSASLAGGVDGFLSRRSGNHRRNLKKQMQRANRQGVYFERYNPRNESEVDTIYDRMIQVEKASWKGIEQCGMAEHPALKYYHLMLKRLAESASARIILAKYEDHDIGFIFGGLAANIYRGQQFSFVDDWRNYSIGNLLQLEQIQWLSEEGIERYDMGPMMEYKKHWTETTVNIETWFLKPG